MGEKMVEEQFTGYTELFQNLWIFLKFQKRHLAQCHRFFVLSKSMADYTVKTFGMQLCVYAVGLKTQFTSPR